MKQRKENKTQVLAHWFVTEVIGRPWTNDDYRSMHMRHAADLLKDYSLEDIQGCLKAMVDELLGELPFGIKSLTAIRGGEPPWISRWFEYKKDPPPIYEVDNYKDWKRRTDAAAQENGYLESELSNVTLSS